MDLKYYSVIMTFIIIVIYTVACHNDMSALANGLPT